VWRDRIQVTLKGGGQFTLKRIRRGKTFDLPSWRPTESNPDSYNATEVGEGILRVTYKHTPVREDTKIDVIYEYDNDDPLTKLYWDLNLIVMAEGKQKTATTTASTHKKG
jgi:hypothetical protein